MPRFPVQDGEKILTLYESKNGKIKDDTKSVSLNEEGRQSMQLCVGWREQN